ncbi:MAG: TIGR03905 family TSCPD domain-containing protein, partial [Clostridia bacterium]|nr:TIGR03905 family TSCPD domain-containing protein [Clostridia bacterium]
FIGGCDGNAKGLAALVEGMDMDDVMERLSGIHCGPRPTSCPDQLAKALQAFKDQEASGKQDG